MNNLINPIELNTIIEVLGLVGIIWGLYYASKQIRQASLIYNETLNWNRKIYTDERLEKKPDQKIIDKLEKLFSTKNSIDPISVKKIIKEIDKDSKIHGFIAYKLNRYERLARGIRFNIIDEDLVKESLGYYLVKAYLNYKSYIEYYNKSSFTKGLENFLWLAERWLMEDEFRDIYLKEIKKYPRKNV